MKNKRFIAPIEEPQINLTALIDVVFVILIMFIVVAPLLDVDRIELAKGNHPQNSVQDENHPIAIRVYKDNSIQYNGRTVLLPELGPLLKSARRDYVGARPQLFHDSRASFGTYQWIKTKAEEAGFEELDIVLAPE